SGGSAGLAGLLLKGSAIMAAAGAIATAGLAGLRAGHHARTPVAASRLSARAPDRLSGPQALPGVPDVGGTRGSAPAALVAGPRASGIERLARGGRQRAAHIALGRSGHGRGADSGGSSPGGHGRPGSSGS